MRLSIPCAALFLAGSLLTCAVSAAEKGAPPVPAPAPAPAEESPKTTPRPSDEDRQRFMSLSDKARDKFIQAMRDSRDKMTNATPEERAAFARKMFDKVEAEDRGAKPAPAEGPAAPTPPPPTVDQARPSVGTRNISPPRTATPSKLLPQNYRVTLSGKEADKPLGSLTALTCSSAISFDGTLDQADPPTIISVSGNLEDEDGSITFAYRIGFSVPLKSSTLMGNSVREPGARPTTTTTVISYKSQTCQGALRMKAGKSYEVLKAGGVTYSVSIAPEADK